ncbi:MULTISPECIES: SH3 domain-containing protein [Stappiaceae]|nr:MULTISPECIES: SH3 domain-containing protein [Stappiaceae]MEC9421548.1 SH3 domain-containing protein [Pseudomonadota bacterium]AMN51231.1 aspartyl-trna synthetase [Labrenzia sp. CP4]MBO6855328.1 aspartyl-trna synthetase [Roseibium sp.]MBO9461525.1 aspartyl-trna synthetase [Labrenzia sp. R5_0]MEE2867779.1 SH3 domain-containing protein [Pseudomonadota bacterium]
MTLLCGLLATSVASQAQGTTTGASGLPVPRFVSLKSDRVNVRIGPSREHDIAWTFVQSGLPVEIVGEFENWRRIRDWEGKQGWVFRSLLSSRRTALVTPWEKSDRTPLRSRSRSDADIVAELDPFVLTTVSECAGGWCRVNGENYDGWLDQTRLFGVYPDELIGD